MNCQLCDECHKTFDTGKAFKTSTRIGKFRNWEVKILCDPCFEEYPSHKIHSKSQPIVLKRVKKIPCENTDCNDHVIVHDGNQILSKNIVVLLKQENPNDVQVKAGCCGRCLIAITDRHRKDGYIGYIPDTEYVKKNDEEEDEKLYDTAKLEDLTPEEYDKIRRGGIEPNETAEDVVVQVE
jgi:hypothetical protein